MKQNLLPKHKSDFIKAFDELFAARFAGLNLSQINTTAANIPKQFLPHLGAAFDIDANNLSEKNARKLIENGFSLSYQAGTAKALKTALKAFYEHSELLEWYEYEGTAYHFKVVLKSQSEPVGKNELEQTNEIINTHKNVRSICDGVRAELSSYAKATNIAAALSYHIGVAVYPKGQEITDELNMQLKASVISLELIRV